MWLSTADHSTASLQFRWLAQSLPHGLFVGEILVFLLFRRKLTKHANHGMRQDAVVSLFSFSLAASPKCAVALMDGCTPLLCVHLEY